LRRGSGKQAMLDGMEDSMQRRGIAIKWESQLDGFRRKVSHGRWKLNSTLETSLASIIYFKKEPERGFKKCHLVITHSPWIAWKESRSSTNGQKGRQAVETCIGGYSTRSLEHRFVLLQSPPNFDFCGELVLYYSNIPSCTSILWSLNYQVMVERYPNQMAWLWVQYLAVSGCLLDGKTTRSVLFNTLCQIKISVTEIN